MRPPYKITLSSLIALFLAACNHDGNTNNQDLFGTTDDADAEAWQVDGIQITVGEIVKTDNPDDGFLHKHVGVSVTGSGGQPAPDDTIVRLRVIDSIIAYGNDGAITSGDNQFVSQDPIHGAFNGTITRQFEPLYVDGAQVLALTGDFINRGRVVSSVTGPNSLDVNMSYDEDKDNLRYWVGKSHYGITVLDDDESTLADGEARTTGGKASVIVRYPEFDCVTGDGECRRIVGYGCGSYDQNGEFLPSADTAFLEEDEAFSEQVILFAEIRSNLSPDSPRHVAVTPDFCFKGNDNG